MEYGVKIETKLKGKNRLLGNKGQKKDCKLGILSYHWPKDKSTKNSIIGILDDWFY